MSWCDPVAVLDHLRETDIRLWWARRTFSARTRVRLYRKMASLTRTGMPLLKVLEAIGRVALQGGRTPNAPLALAIEAWRREIHDGHSFGQALADWAPLREAMIIEAGAGDLAGALEDAAGLVEAAQKMNGAVVTAVGYPLFLTGLLCVLLWIFANDAIPAFAEIRPMQLWTGLAAGMAVLSTVVRHGLLPFLAVAGLLVASAVWSLPVWTGEWRARLDGLPPWSFYRLMQGAGFMTSLCAFLRAGMPVPEALRRLRAGAAPWLAERVDAALYFVNSGHDLGEALHRAGYGFPSRDVIEDLRVYATLGGLDQALARLTAEWLGESLERLRSAGDAVKVLGMVLVAMTIALVQLGIIAIQQQLTGG